jgi:hypothetical protein
MYVSNGNRMRLVVVGIVAAIVFGGGRVKADFTFGEPTALEATINSGGHPWFDCISNDGQELYIEKPIGGGTMSMDYDIFVSTRSTIDDPWSDPVRLGPPINTGDLESFACLSSDDLELYFASNRPGSYGRWDLWVSTRPTRFDSWVLPENLGPTINTSASDKTPWITADGLELYFSSGRSGGYGNDDIWVTRRPTIGDNWGTPMNLGPVVNSAAFDAFPCLSPGGLAIFFSDYPDQSLRVRPGGLGQTDIWMSRRKSITDPWEPPVNLGPGLNSGARDCQPRLSPDGDVLYFSSMRSGAPSGGFNIWQVPITPIVDFNGDGIVDSADMCIIVDHWGENYPLCDIGPTPFGDGIIDIEDLKVLAEHLFEQINDPTLIAHWPLDETGGTTAHNSVNGNDDYVMGGALWQPDGGVIDGALELDGVDDCLMATFGPNLTEGPFSVVAWIKGGAPGQVIFSQSILADWLAIDVSTGTLMTELKSSNGLVVPLLSETVITDGQWHRIGLVWDGSYRMLCVDGVTVAEDMQDGLEGSAGGLFVGVGKNYTPGSFFSGLIDDIRIYNRVIEP